MKIAIINLQRATTLLKNGFKVFGCNILYDDPEFNIPQCTLNATGEYSSNMLIYQQILTSSC
jgi:hypothetical protein